jgi:hypothetical protein
MKPGPAVSLTRTTSSQWTQRPPSPSLRQHQGALVTAPLAEVALFATGALADGLVDEGLPNTKLSRQVGRDEVCGGLCAFRRLFRPVDYADLLGQRGSTLRDGILRGRHNHRLSRKASVASGGR